MAISCPSLYHDIVMDLDRRVFDSIVPFVGTFSSSEFSVDLALKQAVSKIPCLVQPGLEA